MSAPPHYTRLFDHDTDYDIEAQTHKSTDRGYDDTSKASNAEERTTQSSSSSSSKPILTEYVYDPVFPMTGSRQLVLAHPARSEQDALAIAYRAFPSLQLRSVASERVSFRLPSGYNHILERRLGPPLRILPEIWEIIARSEIPVERIEVTIEDAEGDAELRHKREIKHVALAIVMILGVIYLVRS